MREIRTSGLTRGRGNLPPYSTGELLQIVSTSLLNRQTLEDLPQLSEGRQSSCMGFQGQLLI